MLVEHDREVIAAADYLLDFGPGAGDRGGEITARGTPKQVLRSPRPRSPAISLRQEVHPGADQSPHRRGDASRRSARANAVRDPAPAAAAGQGRPAAQPAQHRRGLPAGHVHRRHRRERLRQKFARQRSAVQTLWPAGCTAPAPPPPPTTTSSAWNTSTRSSTSIRTRSATRRRPTRRRTPASST